MIRRGAIQFLAGRHPAFAQDNRAAKIKRRIADRHGDDPFAARRRPGKLRNPRQHIGDATHMAERREAIAQSLGIHMGVRIVEPGNDGAAGFGHTRLRSLQFQNLAPFAHSNNAIAGDGDRLRYAPGGIQRDDLAGQNVVDVMRAHSAHSPSPPLRHARGRRPPPSQAWCKAKERRARPTRRCRPESPPA